MKLDNFILQIYNNNNIEHKSVVAKIENNSEGQQYLGVLSFHIAMINKRKEESLINEAYIAYYNDRPIGFIGINKKENGYEISYGLVPEERGYHLGALLLQEFSEKLFELYPQIKELKLVINCLNTGSKKTALLAGYERQSSTEYTQHRI